VESSGFHGGMMWNSWDNVWNGTIPPGIHLEYGGRVNCWLVDFMVTFNKFYFLLRVTEH